MRIRLTGRTRIKRHDVEENDNGTTVYFRLGYFPE